MSLRRLIYAYARHFADYFMPPLVSFIYLCVMPYSDERARDDAV